MRSIFKISIAVSTMIFIVFVGMIAYHNLEKWNYVDSFYFSSITVMTIGYGDFHPTTPESKIFTVFYAVAGVSVGLATLTLIGHHILESRQRAGRRFEKRFNAAAKRHRRNIRERRRKIIQGSRF